jgi:hypothetical protein
LDHLKGDDVSGGEVGKVGWFEWEVFERHWSGCGCSGECKEGDNGEDIWLGGGRSMWVPSGIDWELAGETRRKRAKEDRDGGGLEESLSGSRRTGAQDNVRS